jgi:hypothetical protein
MNYKKGLIITTVGILSLLISWYISSNYVNKPIPIGIIGTWNSTIALPDPGLWNVVLVALIVIGSILICIGLCFLLITWENQRLLATLSEEIRHNPKHILNDGRWISYEFDDTIYPVVHSFTIRYKDKDYKFMIEGVKVYETETFSR